MIWQAVIARQKTAGASRPDTAAPVPEGCLERSPIGARFAVRSRGLRR